MRQASFYENLAEERINNRYDSLKRRSWNSSENFESSYDKDFSAEIGTHLAMTHKKENYLMDRFQMHPIKVVADLAKDLR